jgi:hypothetical protein
MEGKEMGSFHIVPKWPFEGEHVQCCSLLSRLQGRGSGVTANQMILEKVPENRFLLRKCGICKRITSL